MPNLLQRALLAFPVCALLSTASTNMAQEPGSETLWYAKPAAIWDEALPIGSGRLGAMVFGGANTTANNGDQQNRRVNADIADGSKTRPQDEHMQLNESTLWQGSRADKLNPQGHVGLAIAGNRRPSEGDLAFIREQANAARPEIRFRKSALRWRPAPTHASEQLRSVLAAEALSLLCSPKAVRIGICEGAKCGWLFLDESRGKRRRWCDMNDCGSRAKARRYYQRQKGV